MLTVVSDLTELINGCVYPDIPVLNYTDFWHRRAFALLHIPPSTAAPHVTTKQIADKANPARIILARYALHCPTTEAMESWQSGL
jgi:hypothetical protein